MPITVSRIPRLISQADPDMLKMVLVCGGNSCVVAQYGRQAPLSAAEFAIYDTRRPYEVACGVGGERPTQMMTFMFPPSLLPLSRNRLGQLAAVRFPSSAGLGDLTSQFLLQLARDSITTARPRLPGCRPPRWRCWRHGWRTSWTSAAGARRRPAGTPSSPRSKRSSSGTWVSPAVTGLIAASRHMSLRPAAALPWPVLTVRSASWRVEHCRRDLAVRRGLPSRVAAIAGRWSFSSAGDFSPSFRAVHGLPPAEYRMSARIVNGSAR